MQECQVTARAIILDGIKDVASNQNLVKQNDLLVRTRVAEIVGEMMVEMKADKFAFGAHTIPGMPAKPGLEVRIARDFQIGKTEVTQELYELVTGRNPSKWRKADLPVLHVKFRDAVHFTNLLSEVFDLRPAYFWDKEREAWVWDPAANGFRLPTEVEWEFAARANNDYFYSGSNDASSVGACGKIQPVKSKKPNAWGLYDFSCNAAELTWAAKPSGIDTYSLYRRSQESILISSTLDVIAKGRFLGECKNCGSGAIYDAQFLPQTRNVRKKNEFVGFRLARTIPKTEAEKSAGKLSSDDYKCREGASCRESGRCGAVSGSCQVSEDWMCLQSQDCLIRGRCSNANGVCKATSIEPCRQSAECESSCRCDLDKRSGTCVARSDTCCENRAKCKDEGLCSVSKKTGACVALVDADCKDSTVCSRDGKCKAVKNRCVVTDKSCRSQPACLTDGLCFEIDGECQAKDCRAKVTNVCSFYGRCTVDKYRCVAIANSQCEKADVCLLYGHCERSSEGRCKEPKAGLPSDLITPKIYCTHARKIFIEEYGRKKKAAPSKYERSRFMRECDTQIKARLTKKNRTVFTRVGRCVLEAQTQNGIQACARNTAFDW